MYSRCIMLWLIIVTGCWSLGFSATITVGPGGAPTYNYSSIAAAVNAAAAGSTIEIAGGTYNEWVGIDGKSNLILRGPATGTPAKIAIGASNAVNEGIWINNAQNITLENLTVDMSANNGIDYRAGLTAMAGASFTARKVVLTGGARNLNLFRGADATLIGCMIGHVARTDNWAAGIEIGSDEDVNSTTAKYTHVSAEDCTITLTNFPIMVNPYDVGGTAARTRVGSLSFKRCFFDSNSGGQYDITMRFMTAQWEANSTVLFEDCKWNQWTGYCFHMDSWPTTAAPASVTFRRCQMLSNPAYTPGPVLYLNYRCPVILENVVIGGYGNEGIYVGYYNRGLTMKFCTIANVNDSVIAMRGIESPAPTIDIRNSLIYTPNGFAWEPVTTYNENSTAVINISDSIINSASAKDFNTKLTVNRGTNYTYNTIDPNFIKFANFNSPDADLHLTTGSPAIDTATNIGINLDAEALVRPAGNGYDMGGYELGAQPQQVPVTISTFLVE